MHLDAAVVTDEAELAKAVHKEAYAGPRGADHVRQRLLRDGGNEGFLLTRLAKFRHDQQNPSQALFAGVEELIHKIRLGSHAARQQELQEHVGECRLVMHHANHFISCNLERRAGIHCRGRCQAQPNHRRQRLLADKVAAGEKRDGSFFPKLRNNREFCPATLKIED